MDSTIIVITLILMSSLAYALPMLWIKNSNTLTSCVSTFFTLLVLIIYAFYVKKHDIEEIDKNTIKTMAIAGLLYGAGLLIYMEAIKYGKFNLMKLQTIFMFIISSIIAYGVFGEKINKEKIIGLGLIVMGTLLVVKNT
jgi:uncharacterized membrane protein